MTFDVYKGFNTEPLSENERFVNIERDEDINTEYDPINLVKSYDLTSLPSYERFLSDFVEDNG